MRRAGRGIRNAARQIWRGLREWSGDAAYDRYVQSAARRGAKASLSATEFYVEQLNRKYSRPNRCC
jgi:uncharacterized short protein YbdD (DUF466 family)